VALLMRVGTILRPPAIPAPPSWARDCIACVQRGGRVTSSLKRRKTWGAGRLGGGPRERERQRERMRERGRRARCSSLYCCGERTWLARFQVERRQGQAAPAERRRRSGGGVDVGVGAELARPPTKSRAPNAARGPPTSVLYFDLLCVYPHKLHNPFSATRHGARGVSAGHPHHLAYSLSLFPAPCALRPPPNQSRRMRQVKATSIHLAQR
jgi:hypothetical protein